MKGNPELAAVMGFVEGLQEQYADVAIVDIILKTIIVFIKEQVQA